MSVGRRRHRCSVLLAAVLLEAISRKLPFCFLLNHPGGREIASTFHAAPYPPCCIWTYSNAINTAGETAGDYNDGFNINHGFVRARDAAITTLDAPAASTGNFQGTLVNGGHG